MSLGPVSIRRMFGGKGIYHSGIIVGVDLFGDIMLKADAESAAQFAEAGAVQWVYQRPGKAPVAMPYWTVPDEAYDDPDQMASWVRLAYEAGVRAEAAKAVPKPGRRKQSPK